MVAARDRFVEAAGELGIEVRWRTFPEGTRTAADAAAAIGCDVAQIVKSLVFVADDEPVLALTSGSERVDTVRLADAAGAAEVRKADAEEVRTATGYAIGGTPPFAHPAPIRAFLDPRLLEFDEVWAAAGSPTDIFPIAPHRLRDLAGAEVVDFTEARTGA